MKDNRVMLVGYVGKELSVKKIGSGTTRVSLRVATHYSRKDPAGNRIYETVWHNVVAWDCTGDFAERNFVKGSRIMVEGTIEYRTFPDRSGRTCYYTQIVAHSLTNLDR